MDLCRCVVYLRHMVKETFKGRRKSIRPVCRFETKKKTPFNPIQLTKHESADSESFVSVRWTFTIHPFSVHFSRMHFAGSAHWLHLSAVASGIECRAQQAAKVIKHRPLHNALRCSCVQNVLRFHNNRIHNMRKCYRMEFQLNCIVWLGMAFARMSHAKISFHYTLPSTHHHISPSKMSTKAKHFSHCICQLLCCSMRSIYSSE